MNNNELLQSDYRRAAQLYSPASPTYSGRLVLSEASVETQTSNLNEIYDLVIDRLNYDQQITGSFARTFGKLGIHVALDKQATSFSLEIASKHPKGETCELTTARERPPSLSLGYDNQDGELSFVLCDQPARIELALVQALHMFDTAIMTGQTEPGRISRPQLLMTDDETLLKLRSDNPELLLRMYGNVRGLESAPTILGLVAPTALLEKSGVKLIEPTSFNPETSSPERPKGVFVGVTTAKRPHLGHAFLLTKAIGEAGRSGQVIVELNDLGPRVSAMVEQLAKTSSRSFSEVADAITDGDVEFDEIEAAYTNRDSISSAQLPTDFALTRPNLIYRRLLNGISPLDGSLVGLSDSEVVRNLSVALKSQPGYKPVFGESGMGLVSGSGQAIAVERGGQTTMVGLLAALSIRNSLVIIDSPPPFSRNQLKIFSDNNLLVESVCGIGVSIDFDVGSGTKGNSLSLEQVTERLKASDIDQSRLLLVCRDMLESAYYIPGESDSLNPNYASIEAAVAALDLSITKAGQDDISESRLFSPLKLKNISRELAESLLGPLYPDCREGKLTIEQLQAFRTIFPALSNRLSEKLINFVGDKTDGPLQKNFIDSKDRQLLQLVRNAKPEVVFSLCFESYKLDPKDYKPFIQSSLLGEIARSMGYDDSQYAVFLEKLKTVKGVYKVDD